MNDKEFNEIMEEICPCSLQEEWDNSGYQINLSNSFIKKILVALEITTEVVEEAIARKVDMILTHHPLFFKEWKIVDNNNVIGNNTARLIKGNISVYSCHTSFDKMKGGNNDYLSDILGVVNLVNFEGDNTEICRKGELKKSIPFNKFIDFVSDKLDIDKCFMSAIGDTNKTIKMIGLCSGSGGEYIELAKNNQCDVFITGDVKYHDARTAEELKLCVIDAGHFGTEKCFVDNMINLLENKIKNEPLELIKSEIIINPFIKI